MIMPAIVVQSDRNSRHELGHGKARVRIGKTAKGDHGGSPVLGQLGMLSIEY